MEDLALGTLPRHMYNDEGDDDDNDDLASEVSDNSSPKRSMDNRATIDNVARGVPRSQLPRPPSGPIIDEIIDASSDVEEVQEKVSLCALISVNFDQRGSLTKNSGPGCCSL